MNLTTLDKNNLRRKKIQMKKKEIEKLDKLNEEMKLTKEAKEKIAKKVLKNFLILLNILLFFVILLLVGSHLNKEQTLLVYKTISVCLYVFTLVLFEIAYKKDNDVLAIHSIEILILSLITLINQNTFLEKSNEFVIYLALFATAYYVVKNLAIYKKEKKDFLREQSDIKDIIKKESQDKIVQEQIKKNEEEVKPKKRGRPKKLVNS